MKHFDIDDVSPYRKHQGKTFRWIAENDSKYFDWLVRKMPLIIYGVPDPEWGLDMAAGRDWTSRNLVVSGKVVDRVDDYGCDPVHAENSSATSPDSISHVLEDSVILSLSDLEKLIHDAFNEGRSDAWYEADPGIGPPGYYGGWERSKTLRKLKSIQTVVRLKNAGN